MPEKFFFDNELDSILNLNVALEAMLIYASAPDCFNRSGSFQALGVTQFSRLFDVNIKKNRDHEAILEDIKETLITYCHENDKSCYVLIESMTKKKK